MQLEGLMLVEFYRWLEDQRRIVVHARSHAVTIQISDHITVRLPASTVHHGLIIRVYRVSVARAVKVEEHLDEQGARWADIVWDGPATLLGQGLQVLWLSCPVSYEWEEAFAWMRTERNEVVAFRFRPNESTRQHLLTLTS